MKTYRGTQTLVYSQRRILNTLGRDFFLYTLYARIDAKKSNEKKNQNTKYSFNFLRQYFFLFILFLFLFL